MEEIENKLKEILELMHNVALAMVKTKQLRLDFLPHDWIKLYGIYCQPNKRISMSDFKSTLSTMFPEKSDAFIRVHATRYLISKCRTGTIKKEFDKDDKRKVWLSLTPKAIKLIESVLEELKTKEGTNV